VTKTHNSAQLFWRKEFAQAFPLQLLRQDHPYACHPSLRTLTDSAVGTLLKEGFEPAPDDCSAVVHAGSYGAAIRTPGTFTISGTAGRWSLDSDTIDFGSDQEPSPFLQFFVGPRFLKVTCGHELFYSPEAYHLLLTAPPNVENKCYRVWTGLQTIPYRDLTERMEGLRQFNTNVIIEPLASCTVERGTVLAVTYLIPRTLKIVELEQ
jgi:hypothetical protein